MSMKPKIPSLRFPEFSGEWEVKRLGDIGNFIGGGTPETSKKEYWDGDIQWFTPTEIKSDYISKSIRTITGLGLKKSSAKLLPIGAILITTRATIGEVAIATEKCTTNQGFQSLITQENNIFVFNWIKFNKNELIKRANGSTFPEISKTKIEQIIINLPSLPEQQKIADFLSAVDSKIEALSKKQELMEKYKKGVMQKIFSQEIRFKADDGSEFPEWEERRLGDVSYITTGTSNREDSNLDGEYTFFDRSEDIRKSNIFLFDCEAVIVAGEGQQFSPKYFIGKFDLHQRTYAIMKFDGAFGRFIFYFILHHKNYFLSQAVGSTVKSLRLPMLQKMPVGLPSLAEQTKIANFLSSIDSKIEALSKELRAAKNFKKALLQQMFV